jgi:hypothetical protein
MDSLMGGIFSRIGSPRWGAYSPQCGVPIGEHIPPNGEPQLGSILSAYSPQCMFPNGEHIPANGESRLGSIFSRIGGPHWEADSRKRTLPNGEHTTPTGESHCGVYTPEWGVPIGEHILPNG